MDNLDRILRLVKGTFEAQRSNGRALLYRDDILAYQRGSGAAIDPVTNSLPYPAIMRLIYCALNEFLLATGRAIDNNVDFMLTGDERTGLISMNETSQSFFEKLEANGANKYYEFAGPLIENHRFLSFTNIMLLPAQGGIEVYKGPTDQSLWIGLEVIQNQQILIMPGIRARYKISRLDRVFRRVAHNNNVVTFHEGLAAVIYTSEPILNVFRRDNGPMQDTLVEGRWYVTSTGIQITTNMAYAGAIQVDYDISAVEPNYINNGAYRAICSPYHLNYFSMVNLATFTRRDYVQQIRLFLNETTGDENFDAIASDNEYLNGLIAQILLLGNQLRPSDVRGGFRLQQGFAN